MSRVLTKDDRAKAVKALRQYHLDAREARIMRREAELTLLEKLLAEAAMPEWYPQQ
jgi:hypothetical protein